MGGKTNSSVMKLSEIFKHMLSFKYPMYFWARSNKKAYNLFYLN